MKERIYEYLKKYPYGKTPTQIGLALGKTYNTASSSVNNPLKKLMDEGKVLKIRIDGVTKYMIKDN